MNDLVLSSIPISELEILIDNAVSRAIKRQQPQAAPQNEGYATRSQIAEHYHISLPTVHKWMKEGKLKAYHIGGRTLFKWGEVDQAVKAVSYSLSDKKARNHG